MKGLLRPTRLLRAPRLPRTGAHPHPHWLSLRTRVVAASIALASALAIGTGLLAYGSAATLVRSEADRQFEAVVEQVADSLRDTGEIPAWFSASRGPDVLRADDLSVQVVRPDASVEVARPLTQAILPVTDVDLEVARTLVPGTVHLYGIEYEGSDMRVAAISLGGAHGALVISEWLHPTETLLASLRERILAVGAAGVVVAGVLGWLLGWQVTRRLVRLTATAEGVSRTGRVDVTVPDTGADDEVGRLAGAFNTMLARLAGARQDQRRLVEDAAHELRTPLTSLRTNVSVLRRFDELSPDARRQLLDDLQGETRGLTELVNELVRSATEQRTEEEPRPVRLADVVDHAARRAARRSGRRVERDTDDSVVAGRPRALERAVTNLLENAAKFDPNGDTPIEVVVRSGRVEVRDRGPGFAAEDAARLFDRFYRATAARSLPGSGLGLAIVRDVAQQHEGEVFARNREGGGAVVGFTVPTTAPPP